MAVKMYSASFLKGTIIRAGDKGSLFKRDIYKNLKEAASCILSGDVFIIAASQTNKITINLGC